MSIEKVIKYCNERGYKLLLNNELDTFNNFINTTKFKYICKCGTEKIRSYNDIINNKGEKNKDYIPSCCYKDNIENISDNNWFKLITSDEYINQSSGEKWIRFQKIFWVSNFGKVIGKTG